MNAYFSLAIKKTDGQCKLSLQSNKQSSWELFTKVFNVETDSWCLGASYLEYLPAGFLLCNIIQKAQKFYSHIYASC